MLNVDKLSESQYISTRQRANVNSFLHEIGEKGIIEWWILNFSWFCQTNFNFHFSIFNSSALSSKAFNRDLAGLLTCSHNPRPSHATMAPYSGLFLRAAVLIPAEVLRELTAAGLFRTLTWFPFNAQTTFSYAVTAKKTCPLGDQIGCKDTKKK